MKYFRLPIISIVLLLFFISCNTVKNDDEIRSVFRYNEPAGISSLDPAYARNLANIWGVNQLFNSLVSLDSNLRVKASLARSWSVSDDACTYTFTLRDDVYFHDRHLFEGGKGRKLKASDIVFSLNRLCDPSVGSPGAWVMHYREFFPPCRQSGRLLQVQKDKILPWNRQISGKDNPFHLSFTFS